MTDLLKKINNILTKYGTIFIIVANNEMDQKLYNSLARLKKKIYMFQIIDKTEYKLPTVNNIALKDSRTTNISLSRKNTKDYKKEFENRQEIFEKKCQKLKIRLFFINTEENVIEKIIN